MRGTSNKAFPHVLSDDEGSPPEEKTTWWLIPIHGLDGAAISKLYTESERTGSRGVTTVNEGKRIKADKEMFLRCVRKVENFCFSDTFPELEAKGFHNFSDEESLLAAAADITLDQFNEIIETASSAGRLKPADKKKSK